MPARDARGLERSRPLAARQPELRIRRARCAVSAGRADKTLPPRPVGDCDELRLRRAYCRSIDPPEREHNCAHEQGGGEPGGTAGGRLDHRHALLARAERRPCAMRRVPASLQAALWATRPVLRAWRGGRAYQAVQLRPLERLLRRPDREETSPPFPARNECAVLRDGRLQFSLQVLSELGYVEVARDGHAG